tara:strand:+ start:1288 stop:4581 length:3294 start_codon:yes stop_codon:yes gene_type:complete
MISENKTWNILKNYFEKHGLAKHHFDSYNHFTSFGMEKILSTEPDIIINKGDNKYEISFSNINISKPTLLEENTELRKCFYPMEARRRNLTYDSPLFVDINVKYFENDKIVSSEKHNRILIARIPVMLGSDKCHLKDCSKSEKIKKGECEFDEGGYFIINGKERVLITQVRSIYNKVLVFPQKSNSKYKYVSEIRSMSTETGHSVLVKTLIGKDEKSFSFSLPYIKDVQEIGVVFKALGYINEKQIENMIGIYTDDFKKYLKIIIRDSFFIKTQKDALIHIGNSSIHTIKENECESYAKQVVETELFPHLGITATNKEKGMFLGHVCKKTFLTLLGYRKEDDRDNYINKRVETSGILLYDLFRTLWKRYSSLIKQQIEKKKQKPDILSIISRLNIITLGIKYSFSTGNWGVQKNTYAKSGVSQVLSRLSYGAKLSHMRRIMLQVGKEGKNSSIRQINPSQIMFICPTETPEGQPVGTVLNFSLLTQVTSEFDIIIIKNIVEKMKNITLINDIEINNEIKIFVNGVYLGQTKYSCDFIKEFKNMRNKLFPNHVSINYNEIDEEINIYCDNGRMLRPLFKVKNNKILLEETDEDNWDKLVDKNIIEYVDNSEIDDKIVAFYQKELFKYDYDYCEVSAVMMLGVMGSMIPFPDHSQSPRNCYQAAMGKQAMSIVSLSYQLRTDTCLHILNYPQKPIVNTITAEIMGFDKMPSGINAIVAIACYTGFNQEDSIILNKSAIDRGLFHSTTYRTYSSEEKKHGTYNFEKICNPKLDNRRGDLNYNMLDKNGIIKKGSYVEKNDVIVGKIFIKSNKNNEEEFNDCSLVVKKGEEGYIDRIVSSITPNGYTLVKIIIRSTRIPEVGDKFASREAQKGTVGMVFNQIDMPFTKDGIVPDIIINPHCIPSRMTINQLLECVLGKICLFNGEKGDATPFTENSKNITENLSNKLDKYGFDNHGYETMYNGMTGEPLDAKIFIGPTYYQRLKHMVKDKIHARAEGHVTTLTRQPLEGRSRDGGLRFGEMERDCMIAHGTSRFLKERLFEQSDPYRVTICNTCGNFSTTPTFCNSCENDEISRVNLPYASKLLIQELNAMGIKTVIKANN